jgi:hypothetical protein
MIMAALATLTRSDGVLVAVVLAVDFFIHHWRILWRPLFLFALIIIPWYLFSWIYFGSTFPVTLIAKHQQGQMVISDSFAEGFLNLLLNYAKRPLYWSHGIFLFVGLWSWAFKARQWAPLFAWGALYFFSYVLLGVSRYFWYYAPLVPIFVSLIGLGVVTLSTWLSSVFKQNRYEFALSLLFTALLFWPQGQDLFNLRRHPDSRAVVYREVGEWVSTNTEPDASVGTLEVGIIGYYAHRRMIDFAGLIQPDVVRQMHQESTYQETALWAVENYQPDYLILNPLWFPTLMETVVENKCFPQKAFSDETYSGELILYSCDFRQN